MPGHGWERHGALVHELHELLVSRDLPGDFPDVVREVERLVREEKGIAINAIIWVERDSQKGIAVGKNGSVLKRVGRSARLDIAKHLGQAIHLELWVKVRKNWADNESDLLNLGFETP